ncbi:MAG TPA: L,D-transpeptidase family protein [Gemmatimonadaceae bacterium]|nr:L,D-transpeptidase family protein [Gemmatimonadaceae bacterium]
MISVLLGAVALLASGPSDSTSILSKVVTPTIIHTPVVGIKSNPIADSIVVEKSKRTLTLFLGGLPVRSYRVALGTQPVGDKIKIGDGRTPEGVFHIDFKNPQSKYHMALHISYPDAAHVQRANALGVAPGGDIMIHGLPPKYASIGAAHVQYNWTEGCIAVTDQEIEEIWRAVPPGAPIQIKP